MGRSAKACWRTRGSSRMLRLYPIKGGTHSTSFFCKCEMCKSLNYSLPQISIYSLLPCFKMRNITHIWKSPRISLMKNSLMNESSETNYMCNCSYTREREQCSMSPMCLFPSTPSRRLFPPGNHCTAFYANDFLAFLFSFVHYVS